MNCKFSVILFSYLVLVSCSRNFSSANEIYSCIRLEFVGLSGNAHLILILQQNEFGDDKNCHRIDDEPVEVRNLTLGTSSLTKISNIIKDKSELHDKYSIDASGYAAVLISETQDSEVYPFLDYENFIDLLRAIQDEIEQKEPISELMNDLHEQHFRE